MSSALRLLLGLALLAPGAPVAAPAPAGTPRPSLADRLSWNARERTATGLRDLRLGDQGAAREAFDQALALRPDVPLARFNAGTARIGSDDRGAAKLLEPAARQAPANLAPEAWYNLGNARLGAGDARGAVDAYVEALRRRPDFTDAKFNLELALRERQRQESRQQSQEDRQKDSESARSQQAGDQPGQDGSSRREQEQRPSAEQREDEGNSRDGPRDRDRPAPGQPPEPGQGESGADSGHGTPPSEAARQSQSGRQELPQFHDLPDMNAQQAAAILRAVDHLERSHRRARAAERARRQAAQDKDW